MSSPGAGSPIRAASTLALWAAALLGGAGAEEVLSAISASGMRAGVRATSQQLAEQTSLPGPGSPSGALIELLPLLRRGGIPELLLPHAGDLRGLPVGGHVVVSALDAGAVVVLPNVGIGLVPILGQWRAFSCSGGAVVPLPFDALYEIDAAIATATADLLRADIARGSQRVRDQVACVMRAEAVDCPPGTPRTSSALLAKVISLQALLAVAEDHETGAVTSRELAVVDDALRPLGRAVRDGRRAAIGAAVSQLARQGSPAYGR